MSCNGYIPSYIVKVEDNTNYSILHAIELMRLYNELIKKKTITREFFRWIRFNQTKKLTPYVQKLIEIAEISEINDIAELIGKVQNCWNVKYPGEFKIFIFSKYSTEKKPIYKTNTEHYVYPILIYLNDGNHYDGIKSLPSALGNFLF